MNIDTTQKIIDFMKNLPEDLKQIINMIEFFGFEVRVVGGAVRDLLLDLNPRDVDLATTATPDELIYILSKNSKEAEFEGAIDASGLKHGTIKVTSRTGVLYEITSLDFKMHAIGNKIVTSQNNDWARDAKRRDFTINAMSFDRSGKLYDYLNGVRDLKNQCIRFITFYKIKLKLEPISVYRFIKMLTKFKNPVFNHDLLTYAKENRKQFEGVDPLTLHWMLSEIEKGKYYKNAIPMLDALGLNE